MIHGPARTPRHAMLWSILLGMPEDEWMWTISTAETLGMAPYHITRHLQLWESHRWVELRKELNENDRWCTQARLTSQGRVFARVWYEYGDLLVQMDH